MGMHSCIRKIKAKNGAYGLNGPELNAGSNLFFFPLPPPTISLFFYLFFHHFLLTTLAKGSFSPCVLYMSCVLYCATLGIPFSDDF